MEAYSLDLRERICVACDEGTETHQGVADRFGVSRWFVQKLFSPASPAAARSRHDHAAAAPRQASAQRIGNCWSSWSDNSLTRRWPNCAGRCRGRRVAPAA